MPKFDTITLGELKKLIANLPDDWRLCAGMYPGPVEQPDAFTHLDILNDELTADGLSIRLSDLKPGMTADQANEIAD